MGSVLFPYCDSVIMSLASGDFVMFVQIPHIYDP